MFLYREEGQKVSLSLSLSLFPRENFPHACYLNTEPLQFVSASISAFLGTLFGFIPDQTSLGQDLHESEIHPLNYCSSALRLFLPLLEHLDLIFRVALLSGTKLFEVCMCHKFHQF